MVRHYIPVNPKDRSWDPTAHLDSVYRLDIHCIGVSMSNEEVAGKKGDETVQHYDKLGTAYNQAWFYEDGTNYQRWLLERVEEHLAPEADSEVVDLGAGTGNFSLALHKRCSLKHPVLCVDPSEPLLRQAQAPQLRTCVADGLAFASQDVHYDRVLLKEVVHHFSVEELPLLFGRLHAQLRPKGRLLIASRPRDSSHYPFFAGAHASWASAQLHHDVYTSALTTAGFSAVRVETADYPVSMPAHRWFAMIRSRFWSNFAGFSDTELEAGVQEVRAALGVGEDGETTITFPDRILFILADH